MLTEVKMELVYAALLIHKSGKEINPENLNKVMDAVGIKADDMKVKALVAALDGVNIDQAIKEAVAVTAAPIKESGDGQSSEKKEEKKEEEEKKDEAKSAAGLGALFG